MVSAPAVFVFMVDGVQAAAVDAEVEGCPAATVPPDPELELPQPVMTEAAVANRMAAVAARFTGGVL